MSGQYQDYNAIIAPNWLGDIIMAEPLIRELKERFPNSGVILMGNDIAEALLPFIPLVDQFINIQSVRKGLKLAQRKKFAKELKEFNVARAYIVPNNFKAALIPFLAGIPQRSGFIGELRYPLLTTWRKKDDIQLEVSRFSALADLNDINSIRFRTPKLTIKNNDLKNTVKKYQLPDKPLLIIAPGAEFGPSKKWMNQGFNDVIEWAQKYDIHVVLLGTAKDQLDLKNVTPQSLIGKTTIEEAIHLCASANCVLCHDSGLMHGAAAVSTPVVALYGPTSSERTPPLSEKARIIERSDVSCRPCYKKECPLGHHDCMNKISVEEVISALETYF